ncbi:hypothetical protein ACMYZ8_04600 [Bacteroides sp. KG156]
MRRYANKVFKGTAKDGQDTKSRCHGFQLQLLVMTEKKLLHLC